MPYTRFLYERINWRNKSESLTTPLGKTNLNHMDSAIYQIAENLDVSYNEISAGKFDKSDAEKVIVGMPTWEPETGISKTTLNNIENEKVTPRIDQLEKIAKALDCKIGDLVESPYM